jgi:exopolyphosphatase/guanosine-5'-triphosphate,3'-diphosphate pyrophosphatase
MNKRIAQLLPTRRELGLNREAVLVGMGGTLRALARFQQDEDGYPLNKVHNYAIDAGSVDRMSRELFRLGYDDIRRIESIGVDRAETVAAGALIVKLLTKRLGFDRVFISTHGLRDGILTEFLRNGARPSTGIAQKEVVERLLAPTESHARLSGAAELAELAARHGVFDDREKALLLMALEMEKAPYCVDTEPNALFGIVMSQDLPMGHEDQLLLALSLVRARRSRTANWLARRYSALLRHGDDKSMRRIGACLKMMEVLDRTSAQFRASYSGGLRLNISGSEGHFPLEPARTAAMGFSASIKMPVSISGPKERERHASVLREGR